MSGPVRVIPHTGSRAETGPLQIGEDDWPGVFIRGDDAFRILGMLTDPIGWQFAVHLIAELLASSTVGPAAEHAARLAERLKPQIEEATR